MNETTSRHLRSASEVLLWIPIKDGFAEFDEVIMSYSTRLKTLLETVFELRQSSTERNLLETFGPIERLQTVLNVQWTVVESERRLLVAASFDRSWESYFRLLADETGSLLDAIFCHCEGYQGNSCADGFDRFLAWVRQYQKCCDFYFSAAPDVTSDDIRYYRQLAELKADGRPSRISVVQPNGQPDDCDVEKALSAVWGLRDFYSENVAFGPRGRSERQVFDEAVSALFDSACVQVARLAYAPLSRREWGLRRPDEFHAWIGALHEHGEHRRKSLAKRDPPKLVELDAAALDVIQAGILSEYIGTTHGVVLLVQCDRPEIFRKFLAFAAHFTSSERTRTRVGQRGPGDGPWVNVGLTYEGLRRLGLPDATLSQFPKEFREGMEARAGMLGDVGDPEYPIETAPKRPDRTPVPMATVDAVVVVQGRYTHEVENDRAWWNANHRMHEWVHELKKIGARVLHEEPLQRQRDKEHHAREHFGFPDGGKRGSQPVPNVKYEKSADLASVPARDLVALGEILLGYPNDRDEAPRTVQLGAAELLRNGSFMVMRKLEQKVGAFRAYVDKEAKRLEMEPAAFMAMLMGRKVDGSAVVQVGTGPNDFDYDGNDGARCSEFSHIRRTNPRTRDRRVPRLLRRGFTYGPSFESDPQAERGMLFMAYNTNIAEQFETIQRWINGGNNTLLSSAHKDLVCGQGKPSGAQYWIRREDGADVRVQPPPESFVRLHWGAYLFVPSRAALETLAQFIPVPGPSARKIARGREIIESIERQSEGVARVGWKKVLEEPSSSDEATAVWAAVRHAYGGLKRTVYGVLVGNLELGAEVLRDDGHKFSVCEYANRLGKLIGPHYLGFDRFTREYREQSAAPNRAIHAFLEPNQSFTAAREIAKAVLDGLPGREIHTRTLAEQVIGGLCRQWLELASKEQLEALVFTSRYAFQVSPGPWVEARIQEHRANVYAREAPPIRSPLRDALGDNAAELALTGAIVGFAAPAIASVVAILDRWADDGTLWRLAAQLPAGTEPFEQAQRVLLGPILNAFRDKPIPALLYRTAGEGVVLGGQSIAPGSTVIVGLGALYEEAEEQGIASPEQWLFGGEGTAHGCPARNAALAALAGVFSAVVARPQLRAERRFVLSYR